MQFRRRSSGDVNSGVIATVYHPDGEPVDDVYGDVAIIAGVQLSDFAKAITTDFDVDPDEVGTQSVAGILLALADSIGDVGTDTLVDLINGISAGDSQDVLDAIGSYGSDTLVERLTEITDKLGPTGSRNLWTMLLGILTGNTTLTDETDGVTITFWDLDGNEIASVKVTDDDEREDAQLL